MFLKILVPLCTFGQPQLHKFRVLYCIHCTEILSWNIGEIYILLQGFICQGQPLSIWPYTKFVNPCEQFILTLDNSIYYQYPLILQWTRSTQRAQISLAEADHYPHIVHCKNVEPWLWKTTHPPKKKKKKKKVLDHYLHHDLGMLPLLRCFFCSFTHLTIPRSPPKFNQFLLVLLKTRP